MPMLLNGANRPRRSVKRHDAIGGEDIVQDCRHVNSKGLTRALRMLRYPFPERCHLRDAKTTKVQGLGSAEFGVVMLNFADG